MAISVVRLLVLGVVCAHGQAHGYAVRRELEGWRVETWTSVKPGSLYHALHQLAKEGKLAPLGTEASPEGPGRTLYAMTPSGEAEFLALLEAALSSFDLVELSTGVAFMHALPRERAIALLRALHGRMTENRDHLDQLMPSYPHREEPPHTQDLLALWSGALTSTARWTEGVIHRLASGEYVMAGDHIP